MSTRRCISAEGISALVCLISTDDDAYTYKTRINRLAIVQEHRILTTGSDQCVVN